MDHPVHAGTTDTCCRLRWADHSALTGCHHTVCKPNAEPLRAETCQSGPLRTIRHYDAVGLLTPLGRSEGGFRLYTEDSCSSAG